MEAPLVTSLIYVGYDVMGVSRRGYHSTADLDPSSWKLGCPPVCVPGPGSAHALPCELRDEC